MTGFPTKQDEDERRPTMIEARTNRRPGDRDGGTTSKVLRHGFPPHGDAAEEAISRRVVRPEARIARPQTSFSRCPILFFLASRYLRERVGRMDLERDALDDLEPVAADRDVLGRVVGHQAHLAHAEVAQDLAADAVVADVGREAELLVGRDGVVALVLQLVGLQLVDEADAAPLLEQVEEDALAPPRRSSPSRARAARRSRSAPSRRRRRSGTASARARAPARPRGSRRARGRCAPRASRRSGRRRGGTRRSASAGAATRSAARAARSSSGGGSGRRP